jgi:hypothetical protein
MMMEEILEAIRKSAPFAKRQKKTGEKEAIRYGAPQKLE